MEPMNYLVVRTLIKQIEEEIWSLPKRPAPEQPSQTEQRQTTE